MRLAEVAALVHGRVEGDPSAEITGVARIEEAGAGQITFLASPKYAKHLAGTGATAVLVADGAHPPGAPRPAAASFVAVADPYAAFLRLVDLFHPALPAPAPGIDPSARIAATATVGEGASIGACAVVGESCTVGGRAILHPGVVLEAGSSVGEDSRLMEHVVVKAGCRIGRRVTVHPGAVIGSDGFGFAPLPDGSWRKIPQRGIVVVEDDADIGANCTIDRATVGETRIGRGVKLDNLVMVAHNVRIGEHTVIAAQSGIAGSTTVGRRCVFAGQVGVVGHVTIADRVTLGAQAGVSRSLGDEGGTFSSSPAKEHRRALRIEGALRQLPELIAEVRALREELDRLAGRAGSGGGTAHDGEGA